MDIIAALHFIQENIEAFGGDSKAVTLVGKKIVFRIFNQIHSVGIKINFANGTVALNFLIYCFYVGHGTGAACIHFLIASSAVPEGMLFHRAILMSGSGLSPWSLVGDPAHYAAVVANHVNCSVELPHQGLMKCLRDTPLPILLSTPIRPPDFGFAFGPSVDGVVIGEFSLIFIAEIRLPENSFQTLVI